MTTTSKAEIYARKSTESEDRQVLSIDSQVRELSAWAKKTGVEISEVYRESKSAKGPGRPIFDKLFREIQGGRVSEIVCWKLDRLARNPVDGGAVIWAMEEGKLHIVNTPQQTYSNSGNDKFWMQLEFGMASKFIYDLRDNTKRGLRAKYEQGWYPCRAPVGYLNDVRTHTIKKDPDRFLLVRRMWDYLLSGSCTPAQIHKLAETELGLRTVQTKRQGGQPLSLSAVYRLFHNPFYSGVLSLNGEAFRAAHEPMVSVSEFERAQKLLRTKEKAKAQCRSFAFTGLMRCGECGCAITASHAVNRHGSHYEYYHCTKRKRDINCSQPAIRREELERQLASFLASLSLPKAYSDFVVKMLRATFEEEASKDRKSVESMRRRYDAIAHEVSQLITLQIRGLLTEEEFSVKKRELLNEQARIEEFLRDINGQPGRSLRQAERALNIVTGLPERFRSGDNQTKREVVAATGCNPTLLDKKLRIQAQKPFSLIQSRLSGLKAENGRSKPREQGGSKPKNGLSDSAVLVMGDLVKDLQTHFKKEAPRPN
jgi:DNA invertase Pin-like site-specific DNA recombinase